MKKGNLLERVVGSSAEMPSCTRCGCGMPAKIICSWKYPNAGRRFTCCYKGKNKACSFWEWFDPEMCDRSQLIIPGLLTKINGLEAEQTRQKSREKILWLSVVVMVILLLFSLRA